MADELGKEYKLDLYAYICRKLFIRSNLRTPCGNGCADFGKPLRGILHIGHIDTMVVQLLDIVVRERLVLHYRTYLSLMSFQRGSKSSRP